MRTTLNTLFAMAAGLAVAGPLMAAPVPAATDEDLPTYDIDACCELCPRAADPSVYVTQFLRDHKTAIAGKDDWLFRSEVDLGTAFTIDDTVLADLARMVAAFKARGTDVLLFDFPPRGVLHADRLREVDHAGFDDAAALANYRAALQRFRDIGFIVPDYGWFAEHPDGTDYYFHRDGHWTPFGARRTATLIADTLNALPIGKGLSRRPFETRQAGAFRHRGVLSMVANQICGGQYPSEVVPAYITEPVRIEPFTDDPPPEIVLVGTSFSATPTYHFAGFLKQSLQAEVLNVSLSGGNFDGAMTQYLMSETFNLNPPKLVIWEFGHPQIAAANPGQMRRLVPLVSNGCGSRAALLSNEISVGNDSDYTDLLFNGGGQILRQPSRDLVIDIQFADPAVTEFLAESWYLDGKHEVLRVRLNDFTRTAGRFIVELNHAQEYGSQPLIDFRIQIVTPLAKPTTVKAVLCEAGSSVQLTTGSAP